MLEYLVNELDNPLEDAWKWFKRKDKTVKMENTESRLYFASDYMEGAHPAIIQKLIETNLEKTVGYGLDPYTEDAKEKIRKACGAPDAEVFLLVGGTQTNATVIDALLKSYQGVVAAKTGHIATHESGAIEFGGHKVLTLPEKDGKISAVQIEKLVKDFYDDANYEHMVMPGMVYISQPTEYGTLYSKEELTTISKVCRKNHLPLYVDGARLAYALASQENDVTLADLAALCDVFYIGGTKCGALFGEAVVIPHKGLIPHFFTIIMVRFWQRAELQVFSLVNCLQTDSMSGLENRLLMPQNRLRQH